MSWYRREPVRRALAVGVAVGTLALPATASAIDYAPPDRPGPPLSVPQSELESGCAPSFWQQRHNAEFIKALNSDQETFAGISYSVIYTRTDEIVVPNLTDQGSSALHTGDGLIRNVAIQQVCPLDVNEHLAVGTYDPVAYALAIDALSHPGPTDPAHLAGTGVCAKLLMPGVNPLTFPTDLVASLADIATAVATYPHVPQEPPLRCYVTASC
jgi:hypothetical protein